ncbi:hypothetical protein HanXRQr2_Chr11g0498471 [Helianthus annuus]|uniref:Uncharacterized protein n=1 Tax=Helianthus annuus TaxID=4232 RepID=A0A9K3N0L3_HELAN|nr:hypothetical protein HanXRQr2_Chr11g0498471 [Helianthus annuus]KAJ0502118.1 hypothetical protein HanHA300_Chr11g0409041 [Helianthus annuus]KAJ0510089.1 hypothetical protein HanIR_Chr11g0536691 [Helianthus annuus]KAJ0518040.1 hypothetical protein HanHA89_Chr11g0432721 [Helianthus annuus]KAJ0686061.1 hypothetical protein HanLR1_Chr11g0410271 [Helianthus annuus]
MCSAVAELAAIGFDLPKDSFSNLMKLGPHLLAPTGSDLGHHGEEGNMFAGNSRYIIGNHICLFVCKYSIHNRRSLVIFIYDHCE